jgi:cell division protein FtsB
MVRREDGQIIPGLMMLLVAIFALGIMAFSIGKASILRSEAQTAADAAALAAARDVRNQLNAQVARLGYSDLALVNSARVIAAARDYARRNGARVTSFERQGVDVKVKVSTREDLGEPGKSVNSETTKGEARARARVELYSGGVTGGGSPTNLGPLTSGGSVTISDSEWDEFGKTINHPPRCTDNQSDNDVVKLGRFLQEHGAIILENNAFEHVDPVHGTNSYHYRCNFMGALDVNYSGNEPAIVDALIAPLRKLGFRTIWRAPGHFDHLHVDAADGGSIGGTGSPPGAVGPLEDATLNVRLIDWEAPYAQFVPFGTTPGGTGTLGGPPDPQVARAICEVAHQLGANDKVIVSAYEAAIVESGVHNLNYGDRDSLGVFQQRPSQGWGTPQQILNPSYAAEQYISRAIRADRQNPGLSPGHLAQSVQRSAFPDRYDQRYGQAQALKQQYCS